MSLFFSFVILLAVATYSASADSHLSGDPGFVPPTSLPADVPVDIPVDAKQALMPAPSTYSTLARPASYGAPAQTMPNTAVPTGYATTAPANYATAPQAYPSYSAPVPAPASSAGFAAPALPMMSMNPAPATGYAAATPAAPVNYATPSPMINSDTTCIITRLSSNGHKSVRATLGAIM